MCLPPFYISGISKFHLVFEYASNPPLLPLPQFADFMYGDHVMRQHVKLPTEYM